MAGQLNRRQVIAAGAAAAAVGDLAFLSRLPSVAAADVKVNPGHVRLRPEIEPVVRMLEETPRERVLEALAAQVRKGLSYQQVLAGLMLAGVRNIRPRPVGFKFHAVLVVNSAHLASLASPDSDRWLPIFWAVDAFKSSQARDVQEGDWTMSALDEAALPAPAQAMSRFEGAMDSWDEPAADLAAARLARVAGPTEVFEKFWRYGARDFRDIGHKAIYTANAWRTLQVIGWQHSEPILRSLAYALLQRGSVNPAMADQPEDRPWRANLERVKKVKADPRSGTPDPAATQELLSRLRTGTSDEACTGVVDFLNKGTSAVSLWDGVMGAAGELLMRRPGILGIHCVTSANALRYASETTANQETRLLMLLQATAFMTMFRQSMNLKAGDGPSLLQLEPSEMKATGPAALEEIFATVSSDRSAAARKTLAFLKSGSPEDLLTTARRLIFLKGRDSHDYKFSSAALEDYYQISPRWRDLYLASSMFNLRGSGDADNPLVARTRAALGAA